MVYENIDFHNVEKLTATSKGYAMARVPEQVSMAMEAGDRTKAYLHSTGIELRFRLKGEQATIYLQVEDALEAQTAYIYYGSIQGGWQNSSKTILTQKTAITVHKPDNMEFLDMLEKQYRLPFRSDIIRIILPYGTCYFMGAEGDIEPPAREDVPEKVYLAYGSSITHGSLALGAPYTYPFRIACQLGCDYLNLGFAGSACLEKSMAEYLVSRRDWDFASIELGINMLGESFDTAYFEDHVKDFVEIMAADGRPVFATSIFGYNGAWQEKAAIYRDIVKKYAQDRLIFTDGLELLNHPLHISQDLTHPSVEGIADIARNWSDIMKKELY